MIKTFPSLPNTLSIPADQLSSTPSTEIVDISRQVLFLCFSWMWGFV